jgi:Dolichyl-phosphate-mannose-protein mannosyltransferase
LTDVALALEKAPAISVSLRRQRALLSLVALATILRVYAISTYPLAGDEYGSIAEAKSVGLNWNSIIYSGLMHFWIRFGSSEVWLRVPAAIFGAATVAIIFKIGERLGGWRTGVVAGLLAATSPFNIYHSQEVRFYSLFMLAAAIFMLATVHYVDEQKTPRSRAVVLLSGLVLLFSHFLGALALYAQGAATLVAGKSRWSKGARLMVLFGLPILASALLLVPVVNQKLWYLYQVYGNAPNSSALVVTPISVMNLVKAAFAGFVFVFGYHVYPLRLVLVIIGAGLSAFLLLAGARKLSKERQWRVLPFAYLLALLVVYFMLDPIGGRVASGVAPRHIAFVWPAFVLLIAVGLSSLRTRVFQILLVALLCINGLSIAAAWQRDWSYGIETNYRAAADYTSRSAYKDTVVLHDGRSQAAIDYYFPKDIPRFGMWRYIETGDVSDLLRYQRMIFVTDDWELERRRGFERLLRTLSDNYEIADGRVDYPLFEYVLQRKNPTGYSTRRENDQLVQPLSIYGLEFQDLRLPVSVKVKDVALYVIGALGLPDSESQNVVTIPLAAPHRSNKLILLTNVVGASGLQPGEEIADVALKDATGKDLTLALHFGRETESWDKQCVGPCETALQWHKRMAMVGQNGYAGALRDFQAGLHGVAIDLKEQRDIVKVTIKYLANSGHLYVWGIAVK